MRERIFLPIASFFVHIKRPRMPKKPNSLKFRAAHYIACVPNTGPSLHRQI